MTRIRIEGSRGPGTSIVLCRWHVIRALTASVAYNNAHAVATIKLINELVYAGTKTHFDSIFEQLPAQPVIENDPASPEQQNSSHEVVDFFPPLS